MWMQILEAAGLQLIGKAFPRNWEDTIGAANPHGFYESPLRRGVFYGTNPDPRTGIYLSPQATEDIAVKVFIPGLCRSDLAYVGTVLATMRHWREYAASLERLYEIERESLERLGKLNETTRVFMDPVNEWWLENFALIRDLATRKYRAHLVAYETVVSNPDEVLPPILRWMGAPDPDAGPGAVAPEVRTQDRRRIERDHEHAETFDALYDLVANRQPITNEFLEKLNDTHMAMIPAIEADTDRVIQARRTAMQARRRRDPLHPDTLEAIVHADSIRDEEE